MQMALFTLFMHKFEVLIWKQADLKINLHLM